MVRTGFTAGVQVQSMVGKLRFPTRHSAWPKKKKKKKVHFRKSAKKTEDRIRILKGGKFCQIFLNIDSASASRQELVIKLFL